MLDRELSQANAAWRGRVCRDLAMALFDQGYQASAGGLELCRVGAVLARLGDTCRLAAGRPCGVRRPSRLLPAPSCHYCSKQGAPVCSACGSQIGYLEAEQDWL